MGCASATEGRRGGGCALPAAAASASITKRVLSRSSKERQIVRTLLIGSAFALVGLAAASADAMPFPPLADQAPSAITLTAGGCGIGFHRGPYGGCRPNGGAYAYGYHPYAAP
jgi:hypothetical protein